MTLEESLKAGEDALAAAAGVLAKAQDGGDAGLEDDLDDDFAEFDAMVKAEVVDATPYLAALHESITVLAKAVDSLTARVERAEAKRDLIDQNVVAGLKAQQDSLAVMAKAQGALAGTPLRPKSQGGSVTVPTSQPQAQLDAATVFAKAFDVVDANKVGVLEHHKNRGDVDAMLAALTPDQRARAGL